MIFWRFSKRGVVISDQSWTKIARMDTSPEKLCLNWNNFQQNISSAFRELRSDNNFSDVTLACEGGFQVSAHKVILASSSPFFMNILKMNKNPHPLVYMRGMKSEDLVSILDFLYYGEAEIEQQNLDTFLAVAEELKISGLTQQRSATNGKNFPSKKARDVIEESKKLLEETRRILDISKLFDKLEHTMVQAEELVEIETNERESDEDIVEISETEVLETEDAPEFHMEILKTDNGPAEPLVEIETGGDNGSNEELVKDLADDIDIGTKVRSMMDFSENRVMSNKKPGTTRGRARVCKVCGKEGIMSSILIHIETKHMAKVASPCDICGKISKSRIGLIQHKAKKHSNH